MIFWLIAVFSLLGVLTDIYIYRRVVRRHNLGRFFKSAYLVTAIAIDLVVVVALLFHRSSTDADSNVLLRATMWGIGLFFLNFVPKFIYTVISLGDYVVQRFTRRTSHWFGYLGAGLALVAACTLLWGLTWGRTLIRVEEVELEFENLPASFDGTRVVHFTDVHIGSMMCPDRMLEKLVKHINDLKPDIVVNSGDLVNSRSTELDAGKMATLSGIESTYGVFSILGNHDLGMYIRKISAAREHCRPRGAREDYGVEYPAGQHEVYPPWRRLDRHRRHRFSAGRPRRRAHTQGRSALGGCCTHARRNTRFALLAGDNTRSPGLGRRAEYRQRRPNAGWARPRHADEVPFREMCALPGNVALRQMERAL